MDDTLTAGYLARVEANRVGVRSAPDAVFLRLTRAYAGEGQTTCMFAEMKPGQALRLIGELQAAVAAAVAESA